MTRKEFNEQRARIDTEVAGMYAEHMTDSYEDNCHELGTVAANAEVDLMAQQLVHQRQQNAMQTQMSLAQTFAINW